MSFAKKKKNEGLTPEETVEQAKLREKYIEKFAPFVTPHQRSTLLDEEEMSQMPLRNYT